MTEVVLHVYDVTNSGSAKTNSAIVQLNRLLRDGMGLGGIFHSAVEVYDNEEWSFGYCEIGSGVFSCPAKTNPMYSYRESISLGKTSLCRSRVKQILLDLGREWPGYSYDLLSRNCNHFCDALCDRLGVQKFPAWVNRFAHAGDAAVEVAETTIKRLRRAKTDLVTASKLAYRYVRGGGSTSSVSPDTGSIELMDSQRNAANFFRLSMLKTPATFLSRNSLKYREQVMAENEDVPEKARV
ncbi:hypothetical protein GOP47_0002923 [Adiantum capillus-veneris]|uniref:PPPDE domain-containing protein n=1 Tax=Adiantum capillus-veneris TaxID=13818 RepID=A0A9D4VBU7_ADICA|nr:hypothetical protein GOP47_0002923 [Adiantum capillus-veneris]